VWYVTHMPVPAKKVLIPGESVCGCQRELGQIMVGLRLVVLGTTVL